MLLVRNNQNFQPYADGSQADDTLSIGDIFKFIRRQRSTIAGFVLIFGFLAAVYVILAMPRFTADVLVLVEPQRARLLQGQPVPADSADNSLLDSQVEVAQSSRVILKVIADLSLHEDPELSQIRSSLLSNVRSSIANFLSGLLGLSPLQTSKETSEQQQQLRALRDRVSENLVVRRVGVSHVLRISYTASDAERAARIANAVALAYTTDELRAKSDAAQLAGEWLTNRVGELREQALAADRAVQRARTEMLRSASNDELRNEAQVQLRELERHAHTSRVVYEAFLTRYKDASQQQSFPVTDARIITPAERPLFRSHPRTTLILGGAVCLGLLGGVGAGLMRERLESKFRNGQQAERETGLRCLGLVPFVREANVTRGRHPEATRFLLQHPELARHATQAPFSPLTRAIRSVKVELDNARLERKMRVIGVVSTLPGEGASTIAINLAQLASMSGQKVLLIDADFTNANSRSGVVDRPEPGLFDLIERGDHFDRVVQHDAESNLAMIPAGAHRLPNATDILSSKEMSNILDNKSSGYELIILDLPPLATEPDARAIAPLVDAFLLVIAWGSTRRETTTRTLASCGIIHQRSIGCILNKINPRVYD